MKKEKVLQPFDREHAERWATFVEDLRGVVWNIARDRGITWQQVSVVANVTRNTVAKFAYRETKTPQFRTVFGIANACGILLEFRIRRSGERK